MLLFLNLRALRATLQSCWHWNALMIGFKLYLYKTNWMMPQICVPCFCQCTTSILSWPYHYGSSFPACLLLANHCGRISLLPPHCGHGGKCRDFQNCCNPLTGLPGAHNSSPDGWIWADNSLVVLPGLCICAGPVCTCLGVFSTFPQCHPEVDHSASVLLASHPGAPLRLVQLDSTSKFP